MKNLLIFGVIAIILASCNKLNDKNIRGNWEIEKYTFNGADSTSKFLSYFTFNDGGGATYSENQNGTLLYGPFNWSLDEKGQILQLIGLYSDTSGSSLTLPFNVDKKGKSMTLTYEDNGGSIKYELKQVYLEY